MLLLSNVTKNQQCREAFLWKIQIVAPLPHWKRSFSPCNLFQVEITSDSIHRGGPFNLVLPELPQLPRTQLLVFWVLVSACFMTAVLACACVLLATCLCCLAPSCAGQQDYSVTVANVVTDAGCMYESNNVTVIRPTTAEGIRNALVDHPDKQVSVCGRRNSMGGHTSISNGLLIDTSGFSRLISLSRDEATVEPGMTWCELIRFANEFGSSPMITQSYCDFTVGGSLSVNAHGIVDDRPVGASVLGMTVLLANLTFVTCGPGPQYSRQQQQLFSDVIGGYGLFGVIVSVTVRLVPNVGLAATSHPTDLTGPDDSWNEWLNSSDMGFLRVKLYPWSGVLSAVRWSWKPVDTSEMTTCCCTEAGEMQRQETWPGVVSDLSPSPSGLMGWKAWFYTWGGAYTWMHVISTLLGVTDWTTNSLTERNQLMFEQSLPLLGASLHPVPVPESPPSRHSPSDPRGWRVPKSVISLLPTASKHFLQEYFVPQHTSRRWLDGFWSRFTRPDDTSGIPSDPSDLNSGMRLGKGIVLLNLTVRRVRRDTFSSHAYATHANGTVAFVLFFRVSPSHRDTDYRMRSINAHLTSLTADCLGTAYLPYLRHHLALSKPVDVSMRRAKLTWDASDRFQSQWSFEYLPRLNRFTPTPHDAPFLRMLEPDDASNSEVGTVATHEEDTREHTRSRANEALQKDTMQLPLPRSLAQSVECLIADDSGEQKVRQLMQHVLLFHSCSWSTVWDLMKAMTVSRDRVWVDIVLQTKNLERPVSMRVDEQLSQSFYQQVQTACAVPVTQVPTLGYAALTAQYGALARMVPELLGSVRPPPTEETGQELRPGQDWMFVIGDNGMYLAGGPSSVISMTEPQSIFQNWMQYLVTRRMRKQKRGNAEHAFLPAVIKRPWSFYSSSEFASDITTSIAHIQSTQLASSTQSQRQSYTGSGTLPSNSSTVVRAAAVDVVIINIGLHHWTPEQLASIMKLILLLNASVMIVREHDGTPSCLPIINLAHSLFNAWTSVPWSSESVELRNFRPMTAWSVYLKEQGWNDQGQVVYQDGDPTCNQMRLYHRAR